MNSCAQLTLSNNKQNTNKQVRLWWPLKPSRKKEWQERRGEGGVMTSKASDTTTETKEEK